MRSSWTCSLGTPSAVAKRGRNSCSHCVKTYTTHCWLAAAATDPPLPSRVGSSPIFHVAYARVAGSFGSPWPTHSVPSGFGALEVPATSRSPNIWIPPRIAVWTPAASCNISKKSRATPSAVSVMSRITTVRDRPPRPHTSMAVCTQGDQAVRVRCAALMQRHQVGSFKPSLGGGTKTTYCDTPEAKDLRRQKRC